MGRASNRKKARRKVVFTPQRTTPTFQVEGRKQLRLMAATQAADRVYREREECYAQACKVWAGGTEPIHAPTPSWARGVLGQEFAADPFLGEAQKAPGLATAVVPPAVVIADDPTHWHVAANVLIRAAVLLRALDGVIPGVAGSTVSEVLIREVNPLAALAASGGVQPSDVLGAGLSILQAFIGIFETEAALISGKVA
jgi:hypothetical protein